MKKLVKKYNFFRMATAFTPVILLLIIAGGCSGTGKASLNVIVKDLQQLPITNVPVELSSSLLSKKIKKLTDNNGRCTFENLPKGNNYIIRIRKKGFLPVRKKNIEVKNQHSKKIHILMRVNQKIIPGRWRMAQDLNSNKELSDKQKKQKQQLETLGYLAGHKIKNTRKNVTFYAESKAYNGLNLYCSGHGPEAVLMDMKGKVLHRWRYEMAKVWGDKYNPMIPEHQFWRRVHLAENGNLFAIFEGFGLIKLDKDSNLIWGYNGKAHHDLFIMPNGTIYVLTRRGVLNKEYNKKNLILEDFIVTLTPDGEEIRRVSILKALENSKFAHLLKKRRTWGDFLHTNTLEVLDGRLAAKSDAFKKGNVLISILYLNFVGVVDMEKETVVWGMAGPWRLQHQPSVLDNGNILLLDNLWEKKKQSRIVEFEPLSGKIKWQYPTKPVKAFYTFDCGSTQRLPNGNTLISESNAGRAFEITADGKIVWEFYTPHRTGEKNELVASLFEVVRIPSDYDTNWIRNSKKNN